MSDADPRAHWQTVYATKGEGEVSWFQASPIISLEFIRATGAGRAASIIDIGGGVSRLVDALLDAGFTDLSVLDLADQALATSQARLGARAARVRWIAADVTTWNPPRIYDVWHDRAAFHFLTGPAERAAYAARVVKAVRPGGHVIIATFAPDGPERCSGLPVVRHDAGSLADMLGPAFTLVESRRHDHRTPTGIIQKFQFSSFVRAA